MSINSRIKEVRISKNVTQEELALRIHKTLSTVKKYESGDISLNIDTLDDIANALDVPLIYLIDADNKSLFKIFLDSTNLGGLSKRETIDLKIEFNTLVNYLIFKHTKK